MPSIDDVAKKAGVSTATVSRSFRTPGLLSEETQRRVIDAARQLNYRPRGSRVRSFSDPVERDPARKGNAVIGFQFFADRPEDTLQTNRFYAPMLMGAQDEASVLGLHLLLNTTDRHRLGKELPKMVQERAIAGMLLVGTGANQDILSFFADNMPNLVLLDDRDPTGRLECITSDGFGGARQAVQYLLELGHRRIGYYLGETDVRPFQDRLHGYLSALFDSGIVPDPRLVIGGKFEDTDEMREEALISLMNSENRPTAMLVSNDEYAFLVLRVLRQNGLRVPTDISLIGFDDVAFCTHTDPALTTVRVDKEGIGRLGVRRLYSQICADGAELVPAHNQVSVSLVIRDSCRRL